MFGIAVKATASEIRQVWAKVEMKREEIYEEEIAFLEGLEMVEKQRFWGRATNAILKRGKRVPVLRWLGLICYRGLQTLTVMAIGLVMILFVISAFVDLEDLVGVAGKIALALFYAGICVTMVAGFLHLGQSHYENLLRYQIAIQQILADEYSLATQYSEDVNSYAVMMLAGNDLYFKTAKQIRSEVEKAKEEGSEETFVMGTEEEISNIEDVEFNKKNDSE